MARLRASSSTPSSCIDPCASTYLHTPNHYDYDYKQMSREHTICTANVRKVC